MTHIIGIDPGLTGAVAVLPDGAFFDTPTARTGKGSRRSYLVPEMINILRQFGPAHTHIYVEKMQPMPRGAIASFSLGQSAGLWEGIVATLGIPYTLVTPQRWKGAMMDGMGKEKDASRVRAMQLFPGLAGELGLVKHHGRADALLLAEYGRRQQGREP